MIIITPITYSLIDFKYRKDNNNITKNFVALHPNTNCYNYKYNIPTDSLTNVYISYSKKEIDDFTELLIWPETALTQYINQDSIENSSTYKLIKKNLLEKHRNISLISGGFLDTISYLTNQKPKTESEKFLHQIYRKRKRYNTAFYFNSNGAINTYFKNKLVPFEEYTPYAGYLNVFKPFFESLGGFEFSPNNYQKKNFSFIDDYQLIPVICYESLFGEHVAQKIQQIPGIIIVISNEGWMNNMEASNQFLRFSIARAIENKRSVVRSTNYGTSSLIDPKGIITQSVSIKKPSAIKGKATLLDDITIYSKYGDWIGILSLVLVVFFALFRLFAKIKSLTTKPN